MDPMAGVWDVLDVSVREQTLDLWVVVRAAAGGDMQSGTEEETVRVRGAAPLNQHIFTSFES